MDKAGLRQIPWYEGAEGRLGQEAFQAEIASASHKRRVEDLGVHCHTLENVQRNHS